LELLVKPCSDSPRSIVLDLGRTHISPLWKIEDVKAMAAVLFREIRPCPRCGKQPKSYVKSGSGHTGFVCNDPSHRETPERSELAPTLFAALEKWNVHAARVRKSSPARGQTLRDLELAGRPLEIGCFSCGFVERVQPSKTGLDLELPIASVADQITCWKCGKRNIAEHQFIYARPARRS
jgi:hypothetical protein